MLKYVKGDVIKAAQEEEAIVILPHVCNDIGGWGRGFVVSLSKAWREPEKAYRSLKQWDLGTIQPVTIPQDGVTVVNMIAQRGIYPNKKGTPPIRYPALHKCIKGVRQIADQARMFGPEVKIFAPKFGAGLAGGDWEKIEEMIKEQWRDFDVTIFEYEKATK